MGSTGADCLTPDQLAPPDVRYHAWARKVSADCPTHMLKSSDFVFSGSADKRQTSVEWRRHATATENGMETWRRSGQEPRGHVGAVAAASQIGQERSARFGGRTKSTNSRFVSAHERFSR